MRSRDVVPRCQEFRNARPRVNVEHAYTSAADSPVESGYPSPRSQLGFGSCAWGSTSAEIRGVVGARCAGSACGDADGVAVGVAAVRDVDELVADPQAEPGLASIRCGWSVDSASTPRHRPECASAPTSRNAFFPQPQCAGGFGSPHSLGEAVPEDLQPAVAEGAQGGVVALSCGDLRPLLLRVGPLGVLAGRLTAAGGSWNDRPGDARPTHRPTPAARPTRPLPVPRGVAA